MKTLEDTAEVLPLLPCVAIAELRDIRLRCEAVACSRVLSLDATLKIQAAGRAANRAIPEEVSDALYDLEAHEKQIVEGIVEELQGQDLPDDVMNAEYKRTVSRHADIRAIQQKAAELWKQKVPFQAKPVQIERDSLKVDDDGRFVMPEAVNVTYRGQTYPVDPYAAFLGLVEDQIIIVD